MDLVHIETIPFYENIAAKFLSSPKSEFKTGLYSIIPNPTRNNYIIKTENSAYEFEFKSPQDKSNLDAQFCRGSSHVCMVKSVFKKENEFMFDLYSFAGNCENFGEIVILAEEENLENLQNKNHPLKIEKLWEQIENACTLNLNGKSYFIMQGDYSKDADSNQDSGTEEGDVANDSSESEPKGAFSILCEMYKKCFAIKVRQKNLTSTGEEKYFEVTGISSRKNIKPAGNFHLVEGKIKLSDQKKAASAYNLEKLKAITEKSGSYLKAWREYTGARGDRILFQARKFDSPHYTSCRVKSNDSVKLYFDEKEKIAEKIKASSVEEIVLYENGEALPIFLQDKKCNFLAYCEKKENAEKERKEKGMPKRYDICCQIVDFKDNWIEIALPDKKDMPSANEVAQKGYVVMSMKGEESQIERQQKAWKMITEVKCGISSLGNILEGNFDIMSSGSTPPKMKITNRVREKIFADPPTDRQLNAIDIALRTPEIALIQGPPGTGKTTVITAVLEILNEIQDKRGVSAGRVLATSYQHDAVENMIERIRVNSLPTWKYGKNRNGKGDYNEHIDKWCSKIEEKVLSFNPDVRVSHEEETFHAYVADYVYSPLPENRQRLLEYALTLPVTETIAEKARALLRKDFAVNTECDFVLLRKILALRTTEKAFADDGTKRAEDLYFALEDRGYLLEHKDIEKLLGNIVLDGKSDAQSLSELASLKTKLLEEFSPRPSYVSCDVDDEVVSLCREIAGFLNSLHTKKDKKESIIAEWVESLRNGQEAFSRAIKDCDFVYAATSQQSVGKDILNQKKAVESLESLYIHLYDTVIIDEAARAAPPDLLIPMCNAVKKIILVGDHRQLPQLVDDDLCNDVYKKVKAESDAQNQDKTESSVTDEIGENYEDAFKLSLFELLFKKLKELEAKDGIKRTVTLDTQFRTHPVLGKFCSRLFYEPYGEGYDSPRPASDFAHSLPEIEGKAAVWIDVPKKEGCEEKQGTSRIRECEADCIVAKFMQFVHSQKDLPKDKKFSFGIIAFYSAQRDLILKKLSARKAELKDVTYKVGTVDAFQGMQFDVVFLSVVRTDGDIDFLTPNRLCVSMSRQKKVLIAVGCKDFATSEKARSQKIPALSEFYDLCAGKNDDGYGAVLTWKK